MPHVSGNITRGTHEIEYLQLIYLQSSTLHTSKFSIICYIHFYVFQYVLKMNFNSHQKLLTLIVFYWFLLTIIYFLSKKIQCHTAWTGCGLLVLGTESLVKILVSTYCYISALTLIVSPRKIFVIQNLFSFLGNKIITRFRLSSPRLDKENCWISLKNDFRFF